MFNNDQSRNHVICWGDLLNGQNIRKFCVFDRNRPKLTEKDKFRHFWVFWIENLIELLTYRNFQQFFVKTTIFRISWWFRMKFRYFGFGKNNDCWLDECWTFLLSDIFSFRPITWSDHFSQFRVCLI